MHQPDFHFLPAPARSPLPPYVLSVLLPLPKPRTQGPSLPYSPSRSCSSSQPPAPSFWHTHLLTSWVHGHLLPCRPALLTLLSLGGHDIADKNNVTGASRLQWDGVHPEMLEHIENGLEPQVLDPALTLLVQRQAQVLRAGWAR